MSRTAWITHRASVILMAIGVLVATADGFAQSYAGLYRWATEHGLHGWKADSFPLLVDLFILVGELGLFALALEGHRLRKAGLAWADLALPFGIALAGWSVSLVFNIGAVGHAFSDRATAAVPPVASMLGLLVMLRTVHRLVTRSGDATEPEPVIPVELEWWPLPEVADRPVICAGAGGLLQLAPPLEAATEDDAEAAGGRAAQTLAEAVVAAVESGLSQRETARRFEVSRDRVRAMVDQASGPGARVAEIRPAAAVEGA